MRNGANVKGYMVWSLLDGFEWGGGYALKFGLYYVDVEKPAVRIPKMSAVWLRKFLTGS
ncbi:Putative beta-glucosidase 15, partial [Linum perenne]